MSQPKKMIILKSSDGEIFEVEEAIAAQSQTIKLMIDDDCADTTIPIPNVTGNILSMVINYMKNHATDTNDNKTVEELAMIKSFDKMFVTVDQSTLFDLILAANYLDIKNLMDLTCQTVADMIKGLKSPKEIRKMFNIVNDFTREEEEEMRKENLWPFE